MNIHLSKFYMMIQQLLYKIKNKELKFWLIKFRTSVDSEIIHEEYYKGKNMFQAAKVLRASYASKGYPNLVIEEIVRFRPESNVYV